MTNETSKRKNAPTTRVEKNIDTGMYFEYGNYISSVGEEGIGSGWYFLSLYCNDTFISSKSYNTIQALANAMKADSGDMRKWCVTNW